jgi:rod shape determining protein RodA
MAEFDRQLREHGSVIYRGSRVKPGLRIDYTLLLLLIALMVTGLTILYSASGQHLMYVKKQVLFMSLGLCVMLFVAHLPTRFLERWAFVFYFGGLGLLIAVFFFGVGAKGAQRWLDMGFFRFQPSELLKISVPLMLSSYLGKRILPPRFKYVLAALLMIIVPVILVGIQPDLGTALLIFSAGSFVLFLAGLPVRYLFAVLASALIAAPLFWFYLLRDYQKLRLITLFDPQSDRLGAGWNIIQSTTAIGSGGLTGKGWLSGLQSQLNFLPESHTDFIIAVLSEEFGFIGILFLILIYILIIARGIHISFRAQNMFGRLLAGSITLTFFVYIFVNLGMVSGMLPVVGIPLPMVSYGGTAIVTLMLGFGMLMAIGTEEKRMDQ